ncbi:hypothetical protein [Isoalcanivorax pacificus]|uniref:hypothetical protein n=1 Tax=Isoalcanivorax pacificus TaxID=1306787 RepID=UPI0011846FA4|nr:hypothetical protein [Isoalcanivorax pacificus]
MHIVISWDISAEGNRWNTINDEMKECLSGYSWVRPLKTFYVVKVNSSNHREQLITALQSVAKSNSEKIHFVASPAMTGGSYNGWLPKDLWDKIGERTK